MLVYVLGSTAAKKGGMGGQPHNSPPPPDDPHWPVVVLILQVMSEMSQLASGQKLGKMEQEDMEGVDSDEWGDDDDEDD